MCGPEPTYLGGPSSAPGAFSRVSRRRPVRVQSSAYEGAAWSIASSFGGSLPSRVVITIENQTNIALRSVEGNHKKEYQGICATVS